MALTDTRRSAGRRGDQSDHRRARVAAVRIHSASGSRSAAIRPIRTRGSRSSASWPIRSASDLQAGPRPAIYLPHTLFTLPFMAVVIRSEADEAADRRGCPFGGADARSGAADPGSADAGARARARDRTAALPRAADRRVRGGGAAARGRRALRAHQLHRRAAGAGDRPCAWRWAPRRRRSAGSSSARGCRSPLPASLLGLAGALAATRLLEGLLFAISATDPARLRRARRGASSSSPPSPRSSRPAARCASSRWPRCGPSECQCQACRSILKR